MPKYFLPILLIVLLTACGSAANSPLAVATAQPVPTTETLAPTSVALEHINLGVGYIPNVQFAPFYVAQSKGFYTAEGLEVDLEYGLENDFVTLTAQGERDFAVASGDQVILARAQDLPVVYVMKWYERFPVGVMALAETGIDTPQKLNGHSVGIPGLFGASYVGWQALVYAAKLDPAKINLEQIGFTQAEAIIQKKVDAAVIYVANEPVQLTRLGYQVDVIQVSDYIDLVSNGLITNEKVIQEKPDLVRRLVQATLRGLEYTIAHPDEAFAIVRQSVREITDKDAPTQRAVLDASIKLWRSDQPGISDPTAWATSVKFMQETGLIQAPVNVDTLYTNEFVTK